MKRLALGLLLVATGCSKASSDAKPGGPQTGPRKARVTVAEAQEKEIEYSVESVGSVEAIEEISIPAQVSGIVEEVNFREGDVVDEKKDLVKIDVEKYRLVVVRAQAEHDRAHAQADLAETLYENRRKLQEEGRKQNKEWVSEEQMATWKADFDKASADVARTGADLRLAKRDGARAIVHPPIAGIINGKFVSKGEYVKAETVIAKIVNVSTLRIRFSVPEMDASRLKMKQEILYSVPSLSAGWSKAVLFHMSQKADPSTRAVECMAEVLEKGKDLRAGLFASVRMVTGGQKSIMVPERAVLPTDKGFVVFVLDGDKVKSRLVKIGLRNSDGVELTDGLKRGEKYVVDGAGSLREGAAVESVKGD